MRVQLQALKPLLFFLLFGLLFLSLARSGFILGHLDRYNPDLVASTLLNGLRVDIMTLSMALSVPVLLLLFCPASLVASRWFQLVLSTWLIGWMYLLLFMETATPPYMDFFSARPGRIFFEYLDHPREVTGLIAGGYPVAALLTIFLPIGVLVVIGRRLSLAGERPTWNLRHRLLMIPLFLALVLGARSSLGHRPANPSTFALSGDQLVNDIALNSTYRLLYSIYSLRHEEDSKGLYPEMDEDDILATVKRDAGIRPDQFIDNDSTRHHFGRDSDQNLDHDLGGEPAGKPKNLVIIIEESLGARFVGSLGGLPLTPRLDELADQGIWFENLYATGIRSARGLEAILTGFPPSPARSVLKLSGAQSGFYTIARSLKPKGYHSYFVYGGQAHFDNMQGFLLNNGFDEAIDEDDYKNWQFKGTWGVSDEDLFDKTHEVLSATTGPSLVVAFSSSFHSPYEFPEGKISPYEQPLASKHNAVQYADYALGQFVDKAKTSDYWKDTLLLIVADHDERPRGFDLVPVSSYHIPGVILGGGIEPQRIKRVSSQIDLLPTLFALAGIDGIAPTLGEDVLSANTQEGRAIMQYGDNHAYMRGSRVIIHQPGLQPRQFHYNRDEDVLEPVELEESLESKALAWALAPNLLYRKRLYNSHVKQVENDFSLNGIQPAE
jgi:phosphoglycerol transferase MdoB-like AlkP superfamily enzyme